MIFAQAYWLLLFLLFPLVYWLRLKGAPRSLIGGRHNPALEQASWRSRIPRWMAWTPWLILSCIGLALARPQWLRITEKINADALDIVLSLDISPSMLSRDFSPDRLSVAKRVAIDFVQKRPFDRLGLVAFSGEAFTQCPLTNDRNVIQRFIQELETGRIEDGTDIGRGLATAINRLAQSPSKSKIIILLTDGENTVDGPIPPEQAIEIAKSLGVRVYTIGTGTEGIVMSPIGRNLDGSYEFRPRAVHFNTDLLEKIARETSGKFYRAFSEKDLEGIYAEIDRLEKTRVEITKAQRNLDLFPWLIGAAVLLLLFDCWAKWLWIRTIHEYV